MFAGKLFLTALLLETIEKGVRPRVPSDCPLASIIAECWDSVRALFGYYYYFLIFLGGGF
jgi:hypothetical protein